MNLTWSSTQKQRLTELNAKTEILEKVFETTKERDRLFLDIEKKLADENRERLEQLKSSARPLLTQLERKLADKLVEMGFVQVVTPIILAKGMLDKMTITSEHPLSKQVFWVDKNKCLRPMLAPNLYSLLKDLGRLWDKPVRIFEIGPCFRKESQGAQHLNEFTMLNLVELGTPDGCQKERLTELITSVMEVVGIDYSVELTESEVYGETIDVMAGDLELGSAAYGPHPLDDNWGIIDTWVGVGIGVERLAMAKEGHTNIRRVSRSLAYLDGARLNI